MSAVHSFVALIVGFFSLRFLGQAALSLYSGHTLALWFERRLGTKLDAIDEEFSDFRVERLVEIAVEAS